MGSFYTNAICSLDDLEIIEMMSLYHDSTSIIVFNEMVKRINKSSKTFNQAIKTLFNLNSELNNL